MGDTKHDREVKQLAKKVGGEYDPRKGADIVMSQIVIEYETKGEDFSSGIRQLQGYQKRRYLGVPAGLVEKAMERTKRTKVGVITPNGKIRKPDGRIKRGRSR